MKSVKEVNMVDVFLHMYEYRTPKPTKVILRRGGGRGNVMEGMNGGAL
jgi:hypothetical protein